MNEAFKIVLCLSFSGTVLILGILLLCRVFQKTLSRRWQYYIWLLAVVRLLVPFSGDVNLTGHAFAQLERYVEQRGVPAENSTRNLGGSLPGNGERANSSAEEYVRNISEAGFTGEGTDREAIHKEDTGEDNSRQEAVSLTALTSEPEDSGKIQIPGLLRALVHCLWLIWLAAAALLLMRKITAYQDFLHYIHAGSRPADPQLLEQFGRIAETLQTRGAVELYINPQIASPLLVGCVRPRVILPTGELSGAELRYTMLHELTHYRRKDIIYKWLVQFVICLHWFNPFVWLLGREVDRACELACDEAVLGRLTEEEKRAYGDTLLHAAGQVGPWKNRIGAVTLHQSGRLLKGRLEAVMEYRKRPGWVKVLAWSLAVILAGGAISLGAYAKPGEGGTDPSADSGREETLNSTDGKGLLSSGENDEPDTYFTSGGNDFLLSDGTSVVERDRVFYILCDAVAEEELPLAGAVDGTMLMVVHHDPRMSVTLSTSVLLSNDKSSLQKEAETVCQDMVGRGTLSEEDAARIVETAGELQKRDRQLPLSGSFEGSYYQSAYYRAPYLFFVGYDLTEEAAAQHAGKEILLADGEELRICFADAEKRWMEDEGFLEALSELFSEFRSRTGKRVSEIRRPIISSVEVLGYDVEGLTEGYYARSDWGRFSVLIAELAADRQKEYLEKAFQEEDMAALSITLNTLCRNDRLSDEQIDRYLTRAFENGEVAPFAVLTDYMSRELLQEWYAKLGGEAGGSSYSYILRDLLSDDEEKNREEGWDDW